MGATRRVWRSKRRDWQRMALAGVTAVTIGAMYLGIIKTWFSPVAVGSGEDRIVVTAAVKPTHIR